MTKILHLPVRKEYFLEMKVGIKTHEYRLKTDYWIKRLVGKNYDEIQVKLGYPKKDDKSKILTRPWRGYEEMTITHPHFGSEPVDVFAILVN